MLHLNQDSLTCPTKLFCWKHLVAAGQTPKYSFNLTLNKAGFNDLDINKMGL